MGKTSILIVWLLVAVVCSRAQTTANDGNFKLALPSHSGQLHWHAKGFKIVQTSAKPSGTEIGIRGESESARLAFLGFLFVIPGQAPMTSPKCRDGAMEPEKKSDPALEIIGTSEIVHSNGTPIELVSYGRQGTGGKMMYAMRGFIATGDICGDLKIYSETPIPAEAPEVKEIWATYDFDANYTPQFDDALLYAQILYQNQQYPSAAPLFEQALTKLKDDKSKDQRTWRRIVTDQAGMAYGMAGNLPKARSIFEEAIAGDPEYPLYYYNLACADAGENKLADARNHLQQAFAHKANVIRGEAMPDPTKDDSFLHYRNNKEFWTFLESLH